jgi:hypothetical protein
MTTKDLSQFWILLMENPEAELLFRELLDKGFNGDVFNKLCELLNLEGD